MLVLGRKAGQKIILNDNIIITIVKIVGDKVRVGIEAPQQCSVHREEVYERIKKENELGEQAIGTI